MVSVVLPTPPFGAIIATIFGFALAIANIPNKKHHNRLTIRRDASRNR
jgi:F0F1-type ATP synthase assembly protein I